MIVITGATGKLGGLVLSHLVRLVPPSSVGISVRNSSKISSSIQSLVSQGLSIRRGDYTDPGSLEQAFDGAETLLLISSNNHDMSAGVLEHKNAIDAAKRVGVKTVYYTSHMASSATSKFAAAKYSHAPTEEYLAQSGLQWVSLRDGFHADSMKFLAGSPEQSGVIRTPKDGKVYWATHEDLAECIATLISEKEPRFNGPTPPLAGRDGVTFKDVAEKLTTILGKEIRYEEISDEEYKAGLVGYGVPENLADMLAGMFVASRDGEFGTNDGTLEKIIGRKSASVDEYLRGAFAQA
jgi:uncharacterized protein YbjT (DUF2867 family)